MGLVAGHFQRSRPGDGQAFVVQDVNIHIFLRLNEQLLGAGLVFQTDLIEARSAFGGIALERTSGLVVGQRVGNGLRRVVDASGDERPIRVALKKAYDHFLADAGNEDGTPQISGPTLRNPYPAGAGLVVLAKLIPLELNHDAAVLIGPDLLARFADYDGSLCARDDRTRGEERRAERRCGWKGLKGVRVFVLRAAQC